MCAILQTLYTLQSGKAGLSVGSEPKGHIIAVPVFSQHIANYISGIQTIGHRVIVSDVQESFIWVRYKRNENQLIIFADDTYPRWVTTASLLDYDTVAGADKFGNICVVS